MATINDLDARLRRMETRLVRGFEEMGIDLDVQDDWLTVDESSRTIFLSTMGRSLLVVRKEARRRGAKSRSEPYEIVHAGNPVGTITL